MRRQRPGKQPEVCQASVCGPTGAGEASGCYICETYSTSNTLFVSDRVMKQLKVNAELSFRCRLSVFYVASSKALVHLEA